MPCVLTSLNVDARTKLTSPFYLFFLFVLCKNIWKAMWCRLIPHSSFYFLWPTNILREMVLQIYWMSWISSSILHSVFIYTMIFYLRFLHIFVLNFSHQCLYTLKKKISVNTNLNYALSCHSTHFKVNCRSFAIWFT